MSHVVKVDIQIKDLDALRRAAESLGLQFREGQKTYRWYGHYMGDYAMPQGVTKEQLGKCDHAIGVPGNSQAYEVGVMGNADGTYSLMWDFWQGGYGLQALVGKDCGNLIERYGIEVARSAAEAQGWYVENTAAGGLTLYLPEGGTVEVTPDGKVEANDFLGASCQTATEAIAGAMGRTQEATTKAEYFAEKAKIQLREG